MPKENKNDLKRWSQLSDVAKYHTAPKLFGEEVNPLNPDFTDPKVRAWYEELEGLHSPSPSEKNKEALSLEEECIEEVIDIVNHADIPDDKKTPDALKRLADARERVKQSVRETLESVKKYISILRSQDDLRQTEDKRDDEYLNEVERSSRLRTSAHNALIDNIRITNRFLHFGFGILDEGKMSPSEYELLSRQRENGLIVENISRVPIPRNGILPSSINLSDREQITHWAYRVYSALTRINKYI